MALLRHMRRARLNLPPVRHLKADISAGAVGGVAAIPDGLASAVMAGVNPVFGIYASIFGRIAGGLTTSSAMMCVTTTSAMSITAAHTMGRIAPEDQAGALALLVLIAGLVQLIMGMLRLGFLTRFISNTVVVGFLSGVAATIVISQLGELAGYQSEERHMLGRAFDLFSHPREIQLNAVLVSTITIATAVLLQRTVLRALAMMLALVVATVITHLFGLGGVRLVGDVYPIPAALPLPMLPDFSYFPEVNMTGIAVGIVGLLQGAGVSHTFPNPNGRYPNTSGDFRGQGIANLVCAFFKGIPVSGSFGQTALLIHAGARSRWATLFSGLTAAISILLLAPLVEALPMAAVSGLLVVVGTRAFSPKSVRMIWKSGWTYAAVMIFTFVATLILPIEQAVMLGVLITFVMQIFRAANRLQLLQLIPRPDGLYEELAPPDKLSGREVVVLFPHGSLFFAGAQVLEERLPDPRNAEQPVVLLVLRRRTEMGSTFISMVDRYARKLQARGGKLVLVGVNPRIIMQLKRTGLLRLLGEQNVYQSTPLVGEALRQAYADAEQWLASEEQRKHENRDGNTDHPPEDRK